MCFVKQKTAYEMRISDWSSDVCSSDLRQVYEQAGIGPEDVQAVELHDCFSANELITYESLGLCPEGAAERFIRDGQNSYGGTHVVNPSGGLLSKRSEEHTSALQSLMRISYAVFCLQKKKNIPMTQSY